MSQHLPRTHDTAAEPSLRGVLDNRLKARASAPKRVALVADSAGEIIIAHARLIREARMHGHEVFCFAREDAESFRAVTALGVTPMPLPTDGRDKHDIRALGLALNSLAPDVLAALSWPAGRLAIAAAARARVGRIVAAFPELAGALAPGTNDGGLRRDCAALLSRCHAAIVPGLERDPVVDGRSILPPGLQPCFVAGPGVDPALVSNVPLAPLTKGIVFLAIAYPGSEPGIAAYCESARQLGPRSGSAVFLTVSPPDSEPSNEVLRLMKAYRGTVRYLGPREDIDRLLARAHVAVFPAETPCLPGEIARAVAVGRPIISVDVPARRGMVADDVNGRRVAPGDSQALLSAMLSVMRRPDLIPLYAKQSRRIATHQLDISNIVAAQFAALGL